MNRDRVFGTASARRFALRQMQRQFLRFATEASRLVTEASRLVMATLSRPSAKLLRKGLLIVSYDTIISV